MDWYIVYKGKSSPEKSTLADNLEKAGISYYFPVQVKERLVNDQMVEYSEPVLNNLIFVQTNDDIRTVVNTIEGLKSPYMDKTTGKPAIVSDQELQRFRRVLEARSIHAEFLPDSFQRFECCPKVRVKAGRFAGLEGHVFRIRHDRKLVISLDKMAIALSGIDHTLLEVIE